MGAFADRIADLDGLGARLALTERVRDAARGGFRAWAAVHSELARSVGASVADPPATLTPATARTWETAYSAAAARADLPPTSIFSQQTAASATGLTWDALASLASSRGAPDTARDGIETIGEQWSQQLDQLRDAVGSSGGIDQTERGLIAAAEAVEGAEQRWWSDRIAAGRATRWPTIRRNATPPATTPPPAEPPATTPPPAEPPATTRRGGAGWIAVGVIGLALASKARRQGASMRGGARRGS